MKTLILKDKVFRKHQCGIYSSEDGEVWCPGSGMGKYPNGHFTYGCKNGNGYLKVLYKGKYYQVHRLVAEVFIPNPMNKPEVDHINRNKQDNRVENLRWATHSENCENRDLFNKCGAKIVLQYTKSGEFIKEWHSAHEVERELGFPFTKISACCLGKRKSAYGFIWKYK